MVSRSRHCGDPSYLAGSSVGASSTLDAQVSGCAPLRRNLGRSSPLRQQEGASSKSDGWWCQLPHATQVPGGLLPLRRDVAPCQHFATYQTVYTPRNREG